MAEKYPIVLDSGKFVELTSADVLRILGELKVDGLAGQASTIPVTDVDGQFEDTTATITNGITGGSIVNFQEFATMPNTGDMLIGDAFFVRIDTTTVKLVYYNTNGVHSVTLNLEV